MARSQGTALCVAALVLLAWPPIAAAGPKGASFAVKTRFIRTSYLLEAAEFLVGVPRVYGSGGAEGSRRSSRSAKHPP